MRLLEISLARLTTLAETGEINPRNTVSVPDIMAAISARYDFLKIPKTIEEFDLSKGITFSHGKKDAVNILSLILYRGGTVIDTGSSTQDCEFVLEDLIGWAQELVGVEYSPVRPARKYFLSQLSFHSEMKMDLLNKKFSSLLPRISKLVSSHGQQEFKFETTVVSAMPDLSNIRLGPGAFTIDRLANSPYEDGKYFSSAPLPTDDHLQLLQEFETALLNS